MKFYQKNIYLTKNKYQVMIDEWVVSVSDISIMWVASMSDISISWSMTVHSL